MAVKEMISNWKHTRLKKKILRKEQELRILESEVSERKLELTGLKYEMQELILGD